MFTSALSIRPSGQHTHAGRHRSCGRGPLQTSACSTSSPSTSAKVAGSPSKNMNIKDKPNSCISMSVSSKGGSGLDHPTQEVLAQFPAQPDFQHHLRLPLSCWKRCQLSTLQGSKDPAQQKGSEEPWGQQNNTTRQAPSSLHRGSVHPMSPQTCLEVTGLCLILVIISRPDCDLCSWLDLSLAHHHRCV